MTTITNYPTPIDYTKRNKTSRDRGYNFEYLDIVCNINKYPDWHARRLGGASSGLPDVVATSKHNKGIVMAFECKEGEGNNAYVERKQIARAYHLTNTLFEICDIKVVVLAFKFIRNQTQYKARTKTVYKYIVLPVPQVHLWLTATLKNIDIAGMKYNIVTNQLSHRGDPKYPVEQFISIDKSWYEEFDSLEELLGYVQHC